MGYKKTYLSFGLFLKRTVFIFYILYNFKGFLFELKKNLDKNLPHQSPWTPDFRLMLTLRNQLLLNVDHDK